LRVRNVKFLVTGSVGVDRHIFHRNLRVVRIQELPASGEIIAFLEGSLLLLLFDRRLKPIVLSELGQSPKRHISVDGGERRCKRRDSVEIFKAVRDHLNERPPNPESVSRKRPGTADSEIIGRPRSQIGFSPIIGSINRKLSRFEQGVSDPTGGRIRLAGSISRNLRIEQVVDRRENRDVSGRHGVG
jgi:hypothetical protein